MRLVHALLGKSIAETILLGGLAISFFFVAFPPHFRGWGEATPHGIAGWAVNSAAPGERVSVQLFIDDKFVTTAIANTHRPDVRKAGWALDDWHGYSFVLSSMPPGSHVARVYALHQSGSGSRQTLQLLGDPIHFVVDQSGSISSNR
jgi:hypothetical protein